MNIEAKLAQHLESFTEETGVEVQVSQMKSDNSSTYVLRLSGGEVDEVAQRQFEALASYHDIPGDWYGKVFRDRKTQYKIIGLRPNAPKNAIRIRPVMGRGQKEMVCSKRYVEQAIAMYGELEADKAA